MSQAPEFLSDKSINIKVYSLCKLPEEYVYFMIDIVSLYLCVKFLLLKFQIIGNVPYVALNVTPKWCR